MATVTAVLNPSGIRKDPRQREVWTTHQIAALCGVAPRTVTAWCDRELLPCYRVPGSRDRRILRAALLAFLREHGMPAGVLGRPACDVLALAAAVPAGLDLLPLAYGVRLATNAFECGYEVGRAVPDVLVADLAHAGRAAGLDVCRRAGARAVLLLPEDRGDSLTLGAEWGGALQQPYRPEELAGLVRQLAPRGVEGVEFSGRARP